MKRRKFIRDISTGTAGIGLLGLPVDFYSDNTQQVKGNDALENGFLTPPAAARPGTWWHWRDGPIGEQAITAELEAIKRIGIGGVTLFSSARMGSIGPKITCLSPEWHKKVGFALSEAARLGLSFNFQNCAGWSGSGGPWITPDKAMQHVVCWKATVEGGASIRLEAIPSWPDSGTSFYRDIAILAFETPAAWVSSRALPAPLLTSDFMNIETGKSPFEGNPAVPGKALSPGIIAEGSSGWLQFEYPVPVTCRAVSIAGTPTNRLPDEHRAVVLASDDGVQYHEVVRLSTYLSVYQGVDSPVTHAIPVTTARFLRLLWEGPASIAIRSIKWSGQPAIYGYESKMGEFGRTFIEEPFLPDEPGTAIDQDKIINLTPRLDAPGSLSWSAPPGGPWTILRCGYRNLERKNMPAPPEASGLECDKFNPEAVRFHFDHYAGEIIRDAKMVASQALSAITFDSWEAGSQNWSPVFEEEFRKRRGYEVVYWMPALAGYIVANRGLTDRFLRDIRQTMSDLVSEAFFGTMSRLAHAHGLQVHAESCGGSGAGTMVADGLQHYLHVDVPMNELGWPLKEAVSAARLTGKNIVALEAFTQGRVDWQSCPSSLKGTGDAAFCAGISRFVFHTYAHNPDQENIYPGPAFGPYGLAFSRGQTWWEMSKAWVEYLSKVQYMLQQGRAVVDILYFYGEEPGGPIPFVIGQDPKDPDNWPALPAGFDFDLLPPEILINDLSCRQGLLVTPKGASYKLLVLRDAEKMSPEAILKIRDLVKAGAIVSGPPPARSPGLSNYPACDRIVSETAREIWGDCDGKEVTSHRYGKGRAFWGMPVKDVLQVIGLLPDFDAGFGREIPGIRFIHRLDEETDIYFVSNGRQEPAQLNAGFRITGKLPEIWDPVTGKINRSPVFHQNNEQAFVPLKLDSFGSVFVIFRPGINIRQDIKKNDGQEPKELLVIDGPWVVEFAPGWGAPGSIVFQHLEDWSKRPEKGIQYYSGTAGYSVSFDWDKLPPGPVLLDLGRVEVIAEVLLNGINCGIAWTPPYRVDISKALRRGSNQLLIRAANTWLNRLMADGLGIETGTEKHTWTTINPFTTDARYTVPEISGRVLPYYKNIKHEPVPAGLIGPVKLLSGF